ncbi:hypothetical protein PAXINDRAFT_165239 [Paxillus involutus ATCC 200175]|nr:hypothetical protein PAXINDRAFT_165239 [Paxillus involutus ATCC 200175]
MSNLPLPDGWIQQYNTKYMRYYWVDTKAIPPRAIWTHPYEDGQFLDEHPDIKAKVDSLSGLNLTEPPPYDSDTRRQSWGGGESSSSQHTTPLDSDHTGDLSTDKKRGRFGKLMDIVTMKEEREEHKRIKAEQAARMEEQMRQERMRELEVRAAYMRQHGGYAPYHPSHGGYNSSTGAASSGIGAGTGLLVGTLAGALLLGDMMGGGF